MEPVLDPRQPARRLVIQFAVRLCQHQLLNLGLEAFGGTIVNLAEAQRAAFATRIGPLDTPTFMLVDIHACHGFIPHVLTVGSQ
ncbi:MAG: hypothetical protein WCI73_00035 [Phycisphaerae bacterium]